jgi:hypothetical protein
MKQCSRFAYSPDNLVRIKNPLILFPCAFVRFGVLLDVQLCEVLKRDLIDASKTANGTFR